MLFNDVYGLIYLKIYYFSILGLCNWADTVQNAFSDFSYIDFFLGWL